MKACLFCLLALCSLPGICQNWAASPWTRLQTVDKLSGDQIVTYSLAAQPDGNSPRSAFIAAACNKTTGRSSYVYFTDDMVHVDAGFAHPDTMYYPTTIRYRDSSKVRSAATTVRADFRSINLDPEFMAYFTNGQDLVISFPSVRGYMETDVFSGSLPLQYMGDCYTEKQLKKMAKRK
jgi:hypothetical protein